MSTLKFRPFFHGKMMQRVKKRKKPSSPQGWTMPQNAPASSAGPRARQRAPSR